MIPSRLNFSLHTLILTTFCCSLTVQNNEIIQITNKTYVHCIPKENVEATMYTSPPLNIARSPKSLIDDRFWENNDWITESSNSTIRNTTLADKRWEAFEVKKQGSLLFSPLPISVSFSVYGTKKIKILGNGLEQEFVEDIKNEKKWTTFTFFTNINGPNGETKTTNYYYMGNLSGNYFTNLSKLGVQANDTAYFKIHEYKYKVATNVSSKSNSTKLKVPTTEGFFLMIYVSLCQFCSLDIETSVQNLSISSKGGDDEQWQALRINITSSVLNEVKFIRTQNKSGENGYWKLDVRLHNSGSNVTTYMRNSTDETYSCKYLRKPANSTKNTSNKTAEDTNCHPGLLGTNCDISCKSILGESYEYCENHKIWFSSIVAKCAWGYTGDWCDKACDDGQWGLSCEQKCENKYSPLCDKVNGACLVLLERPPISNEIKTYFTLSKNDFIYPTKKIIAYALILSENPLDLNSTCGFWDGTSKSWPSSPNNSVYLTRPFWNPFKGKNRTCDFIIGTDNTYCDKYCSKDPLKSNTKYWLKVRVFTSTTYHDSSLFSFHTEKITFVNVTSPSTNDSTKAFFLLSTKHVTYSSEVIAYGLYLFKSQIKLPLTNGTWGGTNNSWPAPPAGSILLTRKFWNPFRDCINTSTYKFVIGGNNSCCNSSDCDTTSLKPDSEYWLMVRALTRNVYKDSSLLYFKTASTNDSNFNGHYIVLAILLGVFLIFTIVVVVYLYCKRKNTRLLVNQEENILMADSNHRKSTTVELIDLQNFASESTFLTTLKFQFNSVPDNEQQNSLLVGLQPKNINKNRNRNPVIVPYDYNRVILNVMKGVGTEDYINASYINGYNRPRAYIVCQSPKYYTIRDFWRMIWQENINVIVMATNFTEHKERMCAEYWPQIVATVFECGKFVVRLVKESISECYNYQEIEVVYNNVVRSIIQFHLKWNPDNLFYPNNILPVVKKIRQQYRNNSGPILFHSRYGTGRTGILVLCDLALEMIENEDKVDFFSLTKQLRAQRQQLISTLEHYLLSHLIVNEYFIERNNPFTYSLQEQNVDSSCIKQQLKYLEMLCHYDTLFQNCVRENKIKDYPLKSVSVRRYGNTRTYIISQEPHENQSADFWKMVAAESIRCILFLNNKFPLRSCRTENRTEIVQIIYAEVAEVQHCMLLEVSILIYENVSKRVVHDHKVYLFVYKFWKAKQLLPDANNKFISMVNKMYKITAEQKCALIACSDGYTASGAFIVLSYIIEKYENEVEIDVCSAIRMARRSGKLFINTTKHLAFIYDCVKEYVQNYDKYQQLDQKN